MCAAQAFELGSTGLGSGAFGVLLLRLPQKRFSATQYALLSSLFTLPRILAGPIAGVAADALGWRDFFVLSVFTGIPGMMMLAHFGPWYRPEPLFHATAGLTCPPPRLRGRSARAAPGSPAPRWGVAGGRPIAAARVLGAGGGSRPPRPPGGPRRGGGGGAGPREGARTTGPARAIHSPTVRGGKRARRGSSRS